MAGMQFYKNLHNYKHFEQIEQKYKKELSNHSDSYKNVVFSNILFFYFDIKKSIVFYIIIQYFLPTCDGATIVHIYNPVCSS